MGKRVRFKSPDLMADAVARSRSIAGVLRLLGLRVAGANYDTVKGAVVRFGLNTSHWTGQGHRKGCKGPIVPARPLAQVLVRNSFSNTNSLRIRLLREGVFQPLCAVCKLESWQGRPIPLELDHQDGDRLNNELSNLRLICPNCHAQTPTYRGKNKKRKKQPARVVE